MKALLQQGPLNQQGSPKQSELKSRAMIDSRKSEAMVDSRKQAEMIRLLQDKKIFASIVVDVDPDADSEIVVPLCSCAGKAAEHGVATLSIPRGCFLRRVKLRVTLGEALPARPPLTRVRNPQLVFLTEDLRSLGSFPSCAAFTSPPPRLPLTVSPLGRGLNGSPR